MLKPHERMNKLFYAAADRVSTAARVRYGDWNNEYPDCCDAFSDWFPKYSEARYNWAMSDPEWSEAIMLAVLGGGA